MSSILKIDLVSPSILQPASPFTAEISLDWGAFDTELIAELQQGDLNKRTACRMQNGGITRYKDWNAIQFFFRLPPDFADGELSVSAETRVQQDIFIQNVQVELLERR